MLLFSQTRERSENCVCIFTPFVHTWHFLLLQYNSSMRKCREHCKKSYPLVFKSHVNSYSEKVRGQKVDNPENCDYRTSKFSTANVTDNLEMECTQMKDKCLSSSFSTPAFSPSSKQIRQLPRTQSETQRWVMHSTTWHRGILFCFLVSRLSYSPMH